MTAIEIKGASFRYKGAQRDALVKIDLVAARGERIGVAGLTGAGKSSLLRLVNRLIPHVHRGDLTGTVELFGEDVSGRRPAQLCREVGMVFQDFESQLFSTAAIMDAAFGPENLGLESSEIRRRALEAIERVGLSGLEDRDPATLSGGQKQRLAIACVLAMKPRIVCLDEPTTDLDPQGRDEVSSIVNDLSAEGVTMLVAEHDAEILKSSGRVIGLEEGRMVLDSRPEDLLLSGDLCRSMGVRRPALIEAVSALGLAAGPLSPVEVAQEMRRSGLMVDAATSESLAKSDAVRASALGEETVAFDSARHSYEGGFEALGGVTLSIKAGDFVCLLGRNGSGKTTLAKHINGLLKPSSGSVAVKGVDNAGRDPGELGREVGFVFQDPDHQIFAATVQEEVAFAPRNFGVEKDEIERRVAAALELTGLSDHRESDPFVLTKGMRQRVALASVLSSEPEIIVFDEPTTGLDYPAQRAVMDLLHKLNQSGKTVIVITHALWVAAEYARRLVVMDRGAVVGDGPAREIMSDAGLMEKAGLRVPDITRLGLELGVKITSPAELLLALGRDKGKRGGPS